MSHTYTDLWQASLRHAELQNHKTDASFWTAVNNKFKQLCDEKHDPNFKSVEVVRFSHGAVPVFTWHDVRTQPQIDELKRLCGVS